jgi:hypothetical protein
MEIVSATQHLRERQIVKKGGRNVMTYEKPEAIEIGSVADVVLGQPKKFVSIDDEQLPRDPNTQVAEFDE